MVFSRSKQIPAGAFANRVATPAHFVFHSPEPTGLDATTTFGGRTGPAPPKAVGHEYDALPSRIARATSSVPAGGELPTDPPGIVCLAEGAVLAEGSLDQVSANPVVIERYLGR